MAASINRDNRRWLFIEFLAIGYKSSKQAVPAPPARSAVAALFGLPVQPIRQVSRVLLSGLAFGRDGNLRRRGGVSRQTQRLEPRGLGAQRNGHGFVFRYRLFGVVGAL